MDWKEQAYKEIEILRLVIFRQLEHALKVRGWLFLILSGLTVAFFTNKTAITNKWFLVLCVCLIFMFWILEAIQHSMLRFARSRMAKVESQIRDGQESNYDGPLICNSMAGAWQITGVVKATIKTMFSPLMFIQIVMLIIIVVLLASAKPEDLRKNKNSDNLVGQEIIQNSSMISPTVTCTEQVVDNNKENKNLK